MHLTTRLLVLAIFSSVAYAKPMIQAGSHEEAQEVLFLLGMHCEYMGKFKGVEDTFFTNEGPAYELYKEHARLLQHDRDFSSLSQVWSLLDSYYKKEGTYFSGAAVYYISESVFEGRSEAELLAYLEGVFVREWYVDCLTFANGGDKPKVVAALLRRCGATNIVIREYDENPHRTKIRFDASKQVAAARERALRALEKKKTPNQALQHNDPSCHVPCVRTYRASRGRG